MSPAEAALHPLGVFAGAPHLSGQVALVGSTLLAAIFGRLQLAWRDLEATTWWASNGRDVLVLLSVALQAVALAGLGLPPAGAALVAAQLTLAAVGVEALLLRMPPAPFHDALAVGAAVLVALPVAAAPQDAFELLEAAVRRWA